jgi:hypothetical protein
MGFLVKCVIIVHNSLTCSINKTHNLRITYHWGAFTKALLKLADRSSRGVLPTVMCHCVWSRNLKKDAALARIGLLCQRRKILPLPFRHSKNSCFIIFATISLAQNRDTYDEKNLQQSTVQGWRRTLQFTKLQSVPALPTTHIDSNSWCFWARFSYTYRREEYNYVTYRQNKDQHVTIWIFWIITHLTAASRKFSSEMESFGKSFTWAEIAPKSQNSCA